MLRRDRPEEHQKFKELAALAHSGTLHDDERLALQSHLQGCVSCRQAYEEYSLIGMEGMRFLVAARGHESEDWDDRPARNKVLSRIREFEAPVSAGAKAKLLRMRVGGTPGTTAARWIAAIAACILIAVGVGSYRLGARIFAVEQRSPSSLSVHVQDLAAEKKASDELSLQTAQMSRLQIQVLSGKQEVARLRDALRVAEARFAGLSAVKTEGEEQIRSVSEQRDKLASQLRDSEQAYQIAQTELTNLRMEQNRALLHTASLESKIDELAASTHDQERRLKDDQQYLASDRDIRELMGARKLYIADVFDVDSGSRARKAFGRVFYTQNKSLVFYAFDLDHEPGVKSASAFQVWGQRDAELGPKSRPMNLGILYMDSESNRRWVLRWDDPKQLAEIDAVFVTVEPHGGSQKPTGKPFLYALLRKEANHP